LERFLAVITGASSGIGKTFARRLAHHFDLLLVSRRQDKLDELANELRRLTGKEVDTLASDLTNGSDVEALAERLRSDDRLALLVNNAGFGSRGYFWEAPVVEQEAMHKLHIMTTLTLTHAALGNLVRQDRGGIINVASVAAFVRNAGSIGYAATKTWMTAFTEGLYLELKQAQSDVTVQALCPGYTDTEFFDRLGDAEYRRLAPASFWLTPEEVVDASLKGLRSRKLFVIPNWRYRALTAILSKLPSGLRLLAEEKSSRQRRGLARLQASNRVPPRLR
jgi:uncharacterized protein